LAPGPRRPTPSEPTQLPGCSASDREPMSGCRAPPRRRALAEGAGWSPCCSRYSRSCARWELYLSTPLTSCCAVARPRAVRTREQGSKCPVPVPWPAAAVRLLDCGRRSPDDLLGRQPASAGRVNHACAAAGVSGVVARPRREVGEGPFLPRRRRRLVERVALGRPGDRARSRQPALAWRCRPHLYYFAAVFGPAATPRGQRARRARGRSSPTAVGFARLRWQHLPEA